MSNALPRPSLVFSNITNDLLKERADFIIDQTKGLLDAVSAMEDNTQNFENTFLKIAHLEGSLSPVESIVDFQQYVSTDPEIRKTSSEASSKLQSFGVECSMRRDVYKSLKQVKQEEIDALPATSQRLVKFALRDFERNGLGLPDDQYEELKAIKQEISALCIKFQQHLNEENTKVNFSKDELKGVPESFFAGREQAEDGKYVVTLKYPDLFPILNNCEIPATRRTLYQVNSRVLVDENVPILENVLSLRQKAAKLLGYRSHSDYILETRMAKNLETVSAFLLNLSTKLEAKAKSEIQVLLDLKIQEAKELNLEIEEGIQPYDFRYFHEKNLRDNYKVDHEKIKEYFPLSKVLSGMLDVYQDLFSVKFLQVPEPDVWHPDVELYAVFDKASEELLGHFYLDLFPREGKFGHAAAFPLQQRYKKEDGTIQHPVAAMVTNFTKPAGDLPSLLLFSEVETLFHEFGHIMHNICTKSEFARFSGTQVERDFVEAPSQMLENWCYEASVLQRMSGHYSNLDQSLPDELLRSLVDAKNCDSGLLNRRQIFFATYDVTVHSSQDEKIETRDLWHRLRKEITLIPEDAGSQPVATFGHIVGGYDSQYYGYLYSEVFSADMFQFFKDNGGVMSPDLGRKYRDLILATGGSRDSIDCLKEFLGREPQDDAFLRHIGI